ncbi:hypothetical protein [Sphaerimonospora thailandensis]|uniref:Uncharacterized protein n=1 Tax=Sphaerimonospora thailandensis TaxID=795644 RepID=A0A8J3VZV6_9ACTN|nr:hypothetical protein [Sphaerimonospora thailandensis]GIH71584.1 hypothetical protein Mth01_38370 [Sphaerimonospora thailandensis]
MAGVRPVAAHPVATEAIIHGGFLADVLGFPAAPLEVSENSVRFAPVPSKSLRNRA